MIAILDLIGVHQASFVGLSMGGNITQELVFLHPERVTALVLMDCACNTLELNFIERWSLRMSVPMLRLYPASLLRQQIVNQSSIKPDVRAYIQDACSKVISGHDFMTIWTEVTNCIHEEPDYRITRPLLLMRGDHDRLGNFKSAMPKWAKRDHAKYEVIPDAGHTANQDNPQAINRLLEIFLRQHNDTAIR